MPLFHANPRISFAISPADLKLKNRAIFSIFVSEGESSPLQVYLQNGIIFPQKTFFHFIQQTKKQ